MLKSKAGDTLIEVLFATAIFSAVAIGAIVIMNQGISSAQTSLEISLVRNQIDTQSQLLHQMNDAKLTSLGRGSSVFAQRWNRIISGDDSGTKLVVDTAAQDYNSISTIEDCEPDSLPPLAFFIDPKTGEVVTGNANFEAPVTFAQIRIGDGISTKSQMVWVEVVRSSNPSPGAVLKNTISYDFHIRACWQSPGSDSLMKIGTIVRMYAPNE